MVSQQYHCTTEDECNSFIGSSDRISFNNCGNAVIVFKNPKNSGVTAYITRITFTNLSPTPISIDALSLGSVDGCLKKSKSIVPRNLACLDVHPECKILYGKNVNVDDGLDVAVLSLRPYETQSGPIEDAIILPPGTNRIFVFKSLALTGASTISTTIHWREE